MKRLLKHPWVVIIAVLAVTVFFAIQLGGLRIENSMRSFTPQQHESYQKMLDAEEVFGSMSAMAISLETDEPSIITAEYLNVIDRITQRLEELDYIESVQSLTGIDYVYGDNGALAASTLLPDGFTGTSDELAEVRRRLADWQDMYDRVIISDDGRAVQIQAAITPDLEPAETKWVLNAVREVIFEETADTPLTVKFFGDPVTGENIETFMLSDLSRLVPLVSVIVLITLFLSFKTLDGTLLPLITVLVSTIWTCGLMSLFDVTFTLVSSVIPVALIGVGSAYGIHVLTHYYSALDACLQKHDSAPSKDEHIEIIMAGLKDVWLAVFLAALTTAAGFASLVTSPLQPLHSFAVFSAIGVAVALILSVILIPVLLAAKPVSKIGARSRLMQKLTERAAKREEQRQAAGGKAKVGSTLINIYRTLCGSGGRLALFIGAICVCSYFGLSRLDVDSAIIEYFSADSDFRQDIDYVNENFAGANSLYLIVEGEEKGAMTNPEILKPVDDLQNYLVAKYPEIGKAVSFTTFIKRMNQVMHIPDPLLYADSGNYEESEGEELFSFGSFSDDSFYSSSFFSDDEGGELFSFGFGFEEDDSSYSYSDYVDPNIEFSRRLSETITLEEGLALLNRAYAQAGGARASVDDIVAALERELNYNGRLYYEIPYDTEKYPAVTRAELSDLISQYLLLFSGSLDSFADDALAPSSIRILLQLRVHNTEAFSAISQDAQNYAANHFPEGYTIYPTGSAEMQRVMTDLIVSSQISSLVFSLLSVFVIIMVSFRSVLAGLLGAVPLALTILLNYMVMGLAGIKLDLVTSIIASVAIGVGIDYTIHFLTTYRNERALTSNLQDVLSATFAKSGRGIVTNAIAVGLGFLVLVFSEFVVLRYIGILVAVVMCSSSVLAMTVIPGFLVLFDPKFIRPKDEAAKTLRQNQEN